MSYDKEYAAELDKLVDQTEGLVSALNAFHSLHQDEEDLTNLDYFTYDLRGFIKDELIPLIKQHEKLRLGTDYPKGVLSQHQMGFKTGRVR